jgi:DNA polymerase-3 subunit epsilon
MREIVLDTETTGFDAVGGDRLVEIGCLELINHVPTNKTFWKYINPERDVPQAAFQVHGLSAEFLSDKPKFAEVADQLLEFIGDSPVIAHNAEFDMKFINVELERAGKPTIPFARAIDTVAMARKKFPGAPASLDALCKRFNIDNSNRTLHGALLDAQLLAEVYLSLTSGQGDLGFAAPQDERRAAAVLAGTQPVLVIARVRRASVEDETLHRERIERIARAAGGRALWPLAPVEIAAVASA